MILLDGPNLNTVFPIYVICAIVVLERMHNIARLRVIALAVSFPGTSAAGETDCCPDKRLYERFDGWEGGRDYTDV
jgi:hypothetical protein